MVFFVIFFKMIFEKHSKNFEHEFAKTLNFFIFGILA